ncbi:hypothetical protein MD484_g2440, partial [Candolleomyces efflorescens]
MVANDDSALEGLFDSNIPPSPQQHSVAQVAIETCDKVLSTLAKRLADLESELGAVKQPSVEAERQLEVVEAEKKAIEEKKAKYLKVVSASRRMPSELVVDFVQLACPDTTMWFDKEPSFLPFMFVSRGWYLALYNAHSLWTTLGLDLRVSDAKRTQFIIDRAKRWYSRAGALPLTLFLRLFSSNPNNHLAISYLHSISNNITDLEMRVFLASSADSTVLRQVFNSLNAEVMPWRKTKKLRIDIRSKGALRTEIPLENIFTYPHERFPVLEDLAFKCNGIISKIDMPWNALTTLQLGPFGVERGGMNYCSILRSCASLRSLHVGIEIRAGFGTMHFIKNPRLPTANITLPHLEELSLEHGIACEIESKNLLDALVLPSLRSFSFKYTGPFLSSSASLVLASLTDLIGRSGDSSTIKFISVDMDDSLSGPLTIEELDSLFQEVPGLETLELFGNEVEIDLMDILPEGLNKLTLQLAMETAKAKFHSNLIFGLMTNDACNGAVNIDCIPLAATIMASSAPAPSFEDLKKMPLSVVAEGARAGSITHLDVLSDLMKDPGPECYSLDLLDIHLTYLLPPKHSPSQHEVNLAYQSLLNLMDADGWCSRHPSLREATALRIQDTLDGIIFWMYGLQAIPGRWSTQTLSITTPRRLQVYEQCARALQALYGVHDMLYQACLHNDLVQEMCIGWWVMSYHDGPPYYPFGHPSPPDKPDHQMVDTVTQLFWSTVRGNPQIIANKILEGSVCSPEMFVHQTLERMRVLTVLHELEHLSLAHPEAIELCCIQCILLITDMLIQADFRVAQHFMRVDAQVVYMGVLVETSNRLCAQKPIEQSEAKMRSRSVMDVLLYSLCTVRWQSIVSSNILGRAKGVITQGIVQIIANAIKVASTLGEDSSFSVYRKIFDGLTVYSTYPSVLNKLLREIKRHLGSYHSNLLRGSSERVILDRWMSTYEIFSVKHHPKDREVVCDNMDECQKADWSSRHRTECPWLRKEYNEKMAAEVAYCNGTRAFQLSILKYVFELRMALWVGAPSYRPRSTVKLVQTLDVVDSDDPNTFESLEVFLDRTTPMIPPYSRPRFDEIIRRYEAAHEATRRAAESKRDFRLVRLLNGVFMHGPLDVNMLVLLHEESSGSATRKSRNKPKFDPTRPHDPSTKADMEIETSMVYFW